MNAPPAARALIAEDEPLLAAGLAADLRAHWPGLEIVACVGDGRAALAQALELKPDIAFLDIRMPGLDGLEVAAALVEEWPETERFPLLVFVTAYEQHALVAFERQAVDYLVKPVAPSRLLCAVQRLQRQMVGRAAAPAQDGAALAAELQRLHGVLAGIVTGQAAAPSAAERLDVLPTQAGNLVHLVPVDPGGLAAVRAPVQGPVARAGGGAGGQAQRQAPAAGPASTERHPAPLPRSVVAPGTVSSQRDGGQ